MIIELIIYSDVIETKHLTGPNVRNMRTGKFDDWINFNYQDGIGSLILASLREYLMRGEGGFSRSGSWR